MSEPEWNLRERLADLCHAQWSGWMRYLYRRLSSAGLAINDPGPNRVIERDDYARWLRQMEAPYADLSDAEKNSDRVEADRFIALIGDADRNARFVEKVRERIVTGLTVGLLIGLERDHFEVYKCGPSEPKERKPAEPVKE